MRLSVCIPVYNESACVRDSVEKYVSGLDPVYGDDYELIYCNDGSTDDTLLILQALSFPQLRVIGYRDNRGKGSAVRHAMLEAQGDVIVSTDCDNAYGTEKIIEAVTFLEKSDADVVIGSRAKDKNGYGSYTLLRRIMSKTYILVLRLAAGFSHTDSQCGLKVWRHNAALDVFSRCETDGFAFDIEALLIAEKLGYKIDEIPVRVINHNESGSKIRPLRDTFRMLSDLSKIKKRVRKI